MRFESDIARRDYFRQRLRECLKDPRFRKIPGFPIGSDEAIIELSDPPYFTACPNPFVQDYLAQSPSSNRDIVYHRQPFTADVSEGKNDAVYMAHTYHTKVPHRAIMRYILHYTEPGDVILDGFCGTGMTGVAAKMCGDRKEVESLGYTVDHHGRILNAGARIGKVDAVGRVGERRAILGDLSPAATFIAYNYNEPGDAGDFERVSNDALKAVDRECGWMYLTLHEPSSEHITDAIRLLEAHPRDLPSNTTVRWGKVNYVLWSDVFFCSECTGEIVFWDSAVEKETWKVRDRFDCPHCGATLQRSRLERVMESYADHQLGHAVTRAKQVPALIHYLVGNKRHLKKPDEFDLALVRTIESLRVPYRVPTDRMPEGREARRNDPIGVAHVHQFYTGRNLWALAAYAARLQETRNYVNVTSVATVVTKMYRFRSQNGSLGAGGGPLAGTLYIPSLTKEIPIPKVLREHIKKTADVRRRIGGRGANLIGAASHTNLTTIPDESIDYIFLDPPFGANIWYSELNFIWESWLNVFTDSRAEAVENPTVGKDSNIYRRLMTDSFSEAFRVLKPGRWLTVEFSNTQARIWNAIQTALQEAGFVIANVSSLDKKQGSFKAVTTTTAVKQDLVISAYKPSTDTERALDNEGAEESVWRFIGAHLANLPSYKGTDDHAELIAERDPRILFDRMVAWFIRRGFPLPLSASEFQAGLAERFPQRDGMFFLEDQVAEYDRKRVSASELRQLNLFVNDESSAIQWVRQSLQAKPATFQDLQPKFMRELQAWAKHERTIELKLILDQNFLQYDGAGPVPNQIHSYLSTNYKDLRGLDKDDPQLLEKALYRWYVPDPNKQGDLEKLRERALLKEFDEYKAARKKLKEFRTEAVRTGFKAAYDAQDYKTIVDVANKIPESVLQEDEKLLMYYDVASMRLGD
jgi:hypothetical protein